MHFRARTVLTGQILAMFYPDRDGHFAGGLDGRVCRFDLRDCAASKMGAALTTDIATCVPAANATLLAECLTQPFGACSAGSIDQCGPMGLCLPDGSNLSRTICSCVLYYDPNVNCSKTLFESLPGDMGYQVAGYLGYLIIAILYGLELVANLRLKGAVYLKTLLGITVVLTLFGFGPLSFYSIGVRSVAYMTGDARGMAAAPIPTLVAVAIVTILHIVTCVEWMTMLMTAKHLGAVPRLFQAMRIILWIMALFVLVAVITGMLIYAQISVSVTEAMGLVSKYATILGVIIPLIIVVGFSGWTFFKIRKAAGDIDDARVQRNIKLLQDRTIVQVLGTAVSVANAIYLIATPELLYQKVESVELRDVAGFVYLFLLALCNWRFLTKFAKRFPYGHLDAIRGKKVRRDSSVGSGTQPTSGTGTSTDSGRKTSSTSTSSR